MKRLILLIVFAVIVCRSYSQTEKFPTKYYNVEILDIKDKNLEPILDSIITVDKTRDYYKPDKYYRIFFNRDSTLQIEAFDYLFNSPKQPIDEYGVVLYRGHSFFVSGTYLDKCIFQVTSEKKRYKYYADIGYTDEKGKVWLLISRHADGHNTWVYKYINGYFKLNKFVDTSRYY